VLDDGRVLNVSNVIWCTGFHPGFSWIDLPIFDEYGEPQHQRGIVANEPGLYFVGLHFLYALSSTMIHGIARDAEWIVNAIESRARDNAPGVRAASNVTVDSVSARRVARRRVSFRR
jgi:putative flavoprotein involved in K+ transport